MYRILSFGFIILAYNNQVMIKSKAIEIFESFSTKELRQFGDFVKSPFFNKNDKLLKLYEILKKEYPHFKSGSFTKENVFKQLYPGKKYRDNEIRRNFSDLINLCEKFFVHLDLNKRNMFQNDLSLLNELSSRKIDKLFNSKLKEVIKLYGEYTDIEEEYFRNKFDMQVSLLNFITDIKSGSILDNLDDLFKYSIAYSIIITLKLNQDFLVQKLDENYDYKGTLISEYLQKFNLQEFLEVIKVHDKALYGILKIYHLRNIIAAGKDKDDSYYRELKELVYENLHLFSKSEKYNIILFLENSVSEKLLEGKKDFLQEAQEINEKRLNEDILTFEEDNYLGVKMFRKILETALKLKKTDWALKFIEENLSRLSPDRMDNVKNYSYSVISFTKGDCRKSLELVSKINKYYDFHFEFISKALKLKCLYELRYIEDMYYSLDSYRHSLNSNDTLPELSKAQFRNFMNYFEKCTKLRLRDKVPVVEADMLRDEILRVERILEKDWLIEKLEELKKTEVNPPGAPLV